MIWAAVVLLILAVLLIFYRMKFSGGRKTESSDSLNRDDRFETSIDQEAQIIADQITTEKQLEKLEEQRDKAQEKAFKARTDRAQASAERKGEVLDRAIDLAYNKTLAYQFMPDIGLSTPLNKLESAFEVFSTKDIKEAKNTLGNAQSEWIELTYGEEPEESEPGLDELKKLRTIIESDLPDEKKSAKVNRLVKKSKYLSEDYFYEDDEFSPWDQWKIHNLETLGVPAATNLYRAGYKALYQCLKINPAEVAEINGIGPTAQEELVKFLTEFKGQSS